MIRTRGVSFDENKFYDPRDLDLGSLVLEPAENPIKLIKLPERDDHTLEAEIEAENQDAIMEIPLNPKKLQNPTR